MSKNSSDDSSSSDDTLDLASPNFDPLKALYSDKVKIPQPSEQPLDNLSRFALSEDGTLKISELKLRKPEKVLPRPAEPPRVKEEEEDFTTPSVDRRDN